MGGVTWEEVEDKPKVNWEDAPLSEIKATSEIENRDNLLSRILMAPVHGMMDALHYTLMRTGSGMWRMTSQISKEAERQALTEVYDEDTPTRLQELSDYSELSPYQRAMMFSLGGGDPYGQQKVFEFLKKGGAAAAMRGYGEGFAYKEGTPVTSPWDITASGTAETRAQDWLVGPSGPGIDWVQQNKYKATALGILMDIGYDPVTIFPSLIVLPIKYTVQGLVSAIKALHKITPGAAKATAKLADMENMQKFLSIFGIYVGETGEIQKLFVESAHLLRAANFFDAIATRAGRRDIKVIADRLGISYEDFTNSWRRAIEGDPAGAGVAGSPFARTLGDVELSMLGASSDIHPAVLAMRDKSLYRRLREEATSDIPITLDGEGAAVVKGVDVGEIAGKRAEELGVKSYFPHINLDKSIIGKLFASWGRGRGKVGSQLERKGLGTVEEKAIVENADYVLDPVVARGKYKTDYNIIMAGQNFLRKAAERWGRRSANAPDDWKPVSGIKGVMFHPHVAKILERNFTTLRQLESPAAFEKFVDGATRWWKMWALALRPSYHARNLFGNMWNSYAVGGMRDPLNFERAQRILFQSLGMEMPTIKQVLKGSPLPKASGIPRFSGSVKLGDLGNVSREEIFKWMMEDGIVGVGRYFEDDILRTARSKGGGGVDQSILSVMDKNQRLKAFLNVFNPSTHNTLLRASFRGGRAIENWNRAALYLDGLKRTGSRSKAKDLVNDALFDYTDISPTAARWMRNKATPFYTWYFKNSPAIIKGLFRHSYRYKNPAIIKENIEYGEDVPTYEQLNDFARGRDPVFVQKFIGESGREDIRNIKRFINLLNYWPASDLNRIGSPQDLLAELSNPFIKMIFEQWTNHSYYRKGEIAKIPGLNYGLGEMKDFMGLRMPARIAYLLQIMPLLSEIDRTNPGSVFGRAEVDPKTRERTTSRAMFEPPWQDEKIVYDEKGNPVWELDETGARVTTKSRATLRESKFDELPGLPRFWAWLAGLKSYEFDKPAEFRREYYSNKAAISKTRSDLMGLLKRAMKAKNYDAANEIRRTLKAFYASEFETDPFDRKTSRKRLRAFNE